jgi:hypothetical protein
MELFSKNRSALSVSNPGLAGLLSESEPDEELVAEPTPTGLPTLRYRGRHVHSRRDPRTEAQRFAEHLDTANCFVVLGFGLGYHCEAILERFPEASLLVVVKEPGRLRRALEVRDLTNLLQDPRVQFLLGPKVDEMALLLAPYEHVTIRTVPLLGIAKDDPYFASIGRGVSAYLERRTINLNTLRRFGRRWVRNLIANLPEIGGALGVERASDAFSGVPALVLAAGPSLDQVLPHIRTLTRRCLLIAVDTALPRLAALNIEPDIAVIVDPQYWNSRHLDRLVFNRAVLVSESSTHPRVFRAFASKPLLSSSLFPLGGYVERFLGGFGRLGAGGSVTTTAWDLARVLGCGPILLGGMDLGFPERRTHCHGSFFEERAHTLATGLYPAEQRAFAYLRDGGPFPAPANDGTLVTTDRRMQLYRWWFENQARIYPETETVNLSAGGVALEGIPYRRVEDFVSLPDRRSQIDALVGSLRQAREPVLKLPSNLTSGLEALLAELRGLEKDLQRTLVMLDASGENEPLSDLYLAEFEEIDRRILDNPNREIIAFLALDEAQAVVALGGTPDAGPDAAAPDAAAKEARRRAVELYRSLLKSVRYHSDALSNAAKVYSEEGRHL